MQEQQTAERVMQMIPVTLPQGRAIGHLPGGKNILIKELLEGFCACYTPGGEVLYVRGTGPRFCIFERESLAELGIQIDDESKMPDVVVHHKSKHWLALIEAPAGHGPVNPRRHHELRQLFKGAKLGLVEWHSHNKRS